VSIGDLATKQGIRGLMAVYSFLLSSIRSIARRKRIRKGRELDILLTGVFYSDNWIETHLRPMAMASICRKVMMVAEKRVPEIEKVEPIYPPNWLVKLVKSDVARLLTFAFIALRMRPDIIGGFHLLVNGLLAVLLAKVSGSRSLYICGGGEREVLGGGYNTENRIFRKLGEPDKFVERELLKAVAEFDIVITMGSGAIRFFRERGVKSTFYVVPGGFDGKKFYPAQEDPKMDLILIGRLSPVKCVDRFLHAVRLLSEELPGIAAVVVGDGPSFGELKRLSQELGIENRVGFVGHQEDVGKWLRDAKVFVLTSDSEGLSQAMIQAMMCGLPAVVSNVGDLGDLVEDGKNGYLVPILDAENFAGRLRKLLLDKPLQKALGCSARESASRYENLAVGEQWGTILNNLE